MAQQLIVIYTCLSCGKTFNYVDGVEKGADEMLHHKYFLNDDYATDVQDGVCIKCLEKHKDNVPHFSADDPIGY